MSKTQQLQRYAHVLFNGVTIMEPCAVGDLVKYEAAEVAIEELEENNERLQEENDRLQAEVTYLEETISFLEDPPPY